MRAQIEATKSPSLAITTLSLATTRMKLVGSATAAKIAALFAHLLHTFRIVRMRASLTSNLCLFPRIYSAGCMRKKMNIALRKRALSPHAIP